MFSSITTTNFPALRISPHRMISRTLPAMPAVSASGMQRLSGHAGHRGCSGASDRADNHALSRFIPFHHFNSLVPPPLARA